MTTPTQQPERLPDDGGIEIFLQEDGLIKIQAVTGDVDHVLIVSPFNAWRLFGMLSFMLKIPLSKSVQRRIKL